MIFDDVLSHFEVKSRNGDRAQCICPAHSDKQASLTISQGKKAVVMKCHAGCNTQDIVAVVGLKMSDLFYEDTDSGEQWRRYVEKREGKRIEAAYEYVSSFNGDYAFTKLRLEGKHIIYGRLEDDKFIYGLRGRGRKSFKAMYIPKGLGAFTEAVRGGETVFLVEGEKDVDTLVKRGYTAITAGGAGDWQSCYAELFKGADVVILADNDAPGIRLAQQESADISKVAASCKVIIPTPDTPHGDISDFFESLHDFEALCNGSGEKPLQKIPVSQSPREQQPRDLVQVLRDLDAARNYPTSDLGMSRLFAEVFRDVCRYSTTAGDWMFYDGSRWILDTEGMKTRSLCKEFSDALMIYAASCDLDGKQKANYLKSVARLSVYRNRNTVVLDSRDVHFFSGEQMDIDNYILNVGNGTIDLHGDKPIFREHRASDLLSKVCRADYVPDATCPLWERTIGEIFEGDEEKIDYVQRVLGLCLTGDTKDEKFFIFYGATSRNGKSTICETVSSILGDYAEAINPETLAVKANKDSRTASPDLAKLHGARFVIASEPKKRMILDCGLIKNLSGRDEITARHLYQKEFSFTPKLKLIINANHLPSISDGTVFESNRVKVITFDRHFEEEEQDHTLKDRLKAEYNGILNWLLEGLRRYKIEGLKEPATVKEATHDYKCDSDKLGKFLEDCLEENPKGKCRGGDVYALYEKWCADNGMGCESKSHFFEDMKTRGIFRDRARIDGKDCKRVITGYTIPEFTSTDTDIPFK